MTYRIRPRAYIDHDDGCRYPDFDGITVHEPEDEAQDTGLLDRHGNKIYRTPERRPIGFGHAYVQDAASKVLRDPERSKSAARAKGQSITTRVRKWLPW